MNKFQSLHKFRELFLEDGCNERTIQIGEGDDFTAYACDSKTFRDEILQNSDCEFCFLSERHDEVWDNLDKVEELYDKLRTLDGEKTE